MSHHHDGATSDPRRITGAPHARAVVEGLKARSTDRLRGVLLAAVAAAISGCSLGGPAEDVEGAESGIMGRGPHPRLAHLPDVTGLAMGVCTAELTGCSLNSTIGRNPLLEARRIYDEFFLPRRPASEADWGFRPATVGELSTIDGRPPILPLPIGTDRASKDHYKAWMALQPDPWGTIERRKALAHVSYTPPAVLPFSRNGDPLAVERNLDVLARHVADASLPSTDPRRAKYYEEQNPFDWQSAAMTYYQPPAALRASDIMATNFIWRVLLAPYQMEQALADCTSDPEIPCIDSVAALSDADLYRVYDVRFVRPGAAGLEVSRAFRVVTVDSGHAIDRQSTFGPGATDAVTGAETPEARATPFLSTYGGAGPRLLWRLEVGGQLATTLGAASSGALPGLVRYAQVNGQTPADRPPPESCTDVNDGEWKCTEEDGHRKTVVCLNMLWQTYTSGCRIPGRPATP